METGVTGVVRAIQLAVAPVFLISGIGAMLAVMTNRLSRVVDRLRVLEIQSEAQPSIFADGVRELETLAKRATLISRSIALCTTTALLICAVIAVLFAGTFLGFDASTPVAVLFVAGMLALIAGLLLFLR